MRIHAFYCYRIGTVFTFVLCSHRTAIHGPSRNRLWARARLLLQAGSIGQSWSHGKYQDQQG